MNLPSHPIILIVDADDESCCSIGQSLSTLGFDVLTAGNQQSALEIASQVEIDLVVSEMRIGSDNGIDLYRAIRELPERSDVPIVFVSSAQRTDVILRVHDFGAAYHLRKPIQASVIGELVDRVLWFPHSAHRQTTTPHFEPRSKLFPNVEIRPTEFPYTTSDGSFV